MVAGRVDWTVITPPPNQSQKAIESGHDDAASVLLRLPNINLNMSQDDDCDTALTAAIRFGRLTLVWGLLAKARSGGVDLNLFGADGETPLAVAAGRHVILAAG